MNPFKQKSRPLQDHIVDWKTIAGKPYNKRTTDPYTKIRITKIAG